jgi:hypothetical protein
MRKRLLWSGGLLVCMVALAAVVLILWDRQPAPGVTPGEFQEALRGDERTGGRGHNGTKGGRTSSRDGNPLVLVGGAGLSNNPYRE